jgi:tRNA dimethylallyltransferase
VEHSDQSFNLIVVLGPTATGKTRFAAKLAARMDSEIISADSRQVYRRMNLGTGKDYEDYLINGKQIPYHLIDIHEPGYKYNVYEYQQDFFNVFTNIRERGIIPILCGGTGMYIEAVTKGYKLMSVPVNEALRNDLKDKSLKELETQLSNYKKLHNTTDTDTKKRAIRAIEIEEYYISHPETEKNLPKIIPLYIGISCNRELRRKRITQRLHRRLENGMIEEVKHLLEEGISHEDLVYYGLEYKYITQYLTNVLKYDEMVQKLNIAIHQFAKRQMTWFRKMEREGIPIYWIDSSLPMHEKLLMAADYLKTK